MKRAVVITGASRGIGKAISLELAGSRLSFDTIVLIARPSDDFDQTFAEATAIFGVDAVVRVEADLSNPEITDDIFDKLEQQDIQVETLINNAGFTRPASINETTMDDFEKTMRVNLYAPFKMIQAAICRSHPLKQVINIASTAGINGRAGWLSYSASKAALINMSEVLRDELKPYGVSVVCLSPGRCATDLRRVLAPSEDPQTIMQPQQVANIVAMMMTDTGALINSENIVVRT